MKNLLFWLSIAGGTVVLGAACVAWWEHRRRAAAAQRERAWSDTESEFPDTQSADLDVCLEAGTGPVRLADQSALERCEQATRRAVLDEALDRMAKHKAEPAERSFWADTQPLISVSSPPPKAPVLKPEPAALPQKG